MSNINKLFKILHDEDKVKHILSELYHNDAEQLYNSFADKNIVEFYYILNEEYQQRFNEILEKELEKEI